MERLDSGVRLRGEIEWIAVGGQADVDCLLAAIGHSMANRLAPTAILLCFGNAVGRFRIGDLGTLEVHCGKWSDETFALLLSDLSSIALALPFAADRDAGMTHERSQAGQETILLHLFLYIRHILLELKPGLDSTIQAILREPHRHLVRRRETTPLARATRADARTLVRIACGLEPLASVRDPSRGARPLASALRGHLPISADVPANESDVDTPENRFVLSFLVQIARILQQVEDLRWKRGRTPFWDRVGRDCDEMLRVLRPAMAHSLWRDVSPMVFMPCGSSVLERRRGYKEVLQHQLGLRAAARLPLDRAQLDRLIGLKDVALLYELWAFFQVVRSVEELSGGPPVDARTTHANDLHSSVPWGMSVRWANGVRVYYNLRFAAGSSDGHLSSSVALRPDIVVAVPGADGLILHVLDAKLRLDGATGAFKADDLVKMHAYRDALPDVRSAAVLYPGQVADWYPSHDGSGGGVGVVPLVPGGTTQFLRAHLAVLLA